MRSSSGDNADEIASDYDLKGADVYAALAFRVAHRDEINRSIQEDEDVVRRLPDEAPLPREGKQGRSARPD